MSYLTVGDIFNLLASEIRAQFPNLGLYFAGKNFSQRPELWVYVQDRRVLRAVEKFCHALEKRPTSPPTLVSIKVKHGDGTELHGESENELLRKRHEFLERAHVIRRRKAPHFG